MVEECERYTVELVVEIAADEVTGRVGVGFVVAFEMSVGVVVVVAKSGASRAGIDLVEWCENDGLAVCCDVGHLDRTAVGACAVSQIAAVVDDGVHLLDDLSDQYIAGVGSMGSGSVSDL